MKHFQKLLCLVLVVLHFREIENFRRQICAVNKENGLVSQLGIQKQARGLLALRSSWRWMKNIIIIIVITLQSRAEQAEMCMCMQHLRVHVYCLNAFALGQSALPCLLPLPLLMLLLLLLLLLLAALRSRQPDLFRLFVPQATAVLVGSGGGGCQFA
ncbi:hypothetical protein T4B_11163 [Trichinella pseudospiralis]|uniref:Uncharacterized protein n=1 Tax=Trichinella pseudospiralis TaxID=6337 RepID=A0A0V1IXN4_TRIPS|nr:hypothetical protein T4B_11163 [Trichinella pseudospiralis]